MKKIYLIFMIAIGIGLISCQKESDLSEELSAEDEIAVEGMENAFENAELYNDSLVWCKDVNQNCLQTSVDYYDSLFHYYSDEYDMHHDNYSHNNIGDDHHHQANSSHQHGSSHIEEEDTHDVDESSGSYEHTIDNHNKMNALRDNHKSLH